MIFVDKEKIKIKSDAEPCVCVKAVLPDFTESEKTRALDKPYLNKRNINYYIEYNNDSYSLFIPKGYDWDGASIPFGFRWILGGKGNPTFLIPSMVHDKMCECKWLVNYDRALSSLIFKELLIACECSAFKANLMYFAVDNFQKMFGGWEQ